MKWNLGKTAMWMMTTIAVATMAYATAQDVQLPEGEGKKILQTACTACHGLEGVVKLHLDKDGWEGLISSMVSNGAQVDQKDFPVLTDYLVKNFGPADSKPAGQAPASGSDDDAKKILETACTACHDLDLVQDQHLSKEDWQMLVASMVQKGAAVGDKDVPMLVDYLAKTYGPKK
jgi:cytochrome c5